MKATTALKAGAETWKRWRAANPGALPDWREAQLAAANLSGAP